ncbi:hypothetical protein [Bacillus sp. D386]|uniref:hypothetical protein n=1 Tax=Bacillus sp. D386 TaxID=2587155 RepID=UPI001121DECA|nr:hypothetical protein [Bacillus sp. D386]
MKKFMSLRVLDRGQKLFQWMGIDYPVMRRILQVKLTMDARRVPTLMNDGSGNTGKDSNQFLKSLWVYALMGLILIPFIIMGENYFFQMSMLFAVFMFFIITSLISDFSHVMLDIRDQSILLSRPVDGRTVSVAKLIHIIIYLGTITLIFIAPAFIAAIVTQGIGFSLLFLLVIILIDIWIVLLTALIYLVILKYFDGEKLKDFISYVQISLSILMIVGYQLTVRIFDLVDRQVEFTPTWWSYILAPIWYAAPFEVKLNGNFAWQYILLISLAVIVPLVSVIIYIKNVQNFEQYLQKLTNHTGALSKKKRSHFSMFLLRNKEERVFYHFAKNLMKNEQAFKLKVYPSIGMVIIFPFITLLNQFGENGWKGIQNGSGYYTIYFSALMIPTIAIALRYTDSYKGAWIYRASPLQSAKSIFIGTWNAVMAKYVLPIYLAYSFLFILIYGSAIFWDLLIGLFTLFIMAVLSFRTYTIILPFSKPTSATQENEGIKTVFLLFILGVFAGFHFLISKVEYGLYGYGGVLLITAILVWRYGFRVDFKDLKD